MHLSTKIYINTVNLVTSCKKGQPETHDEGKIA